MVRTFRKDGKPVAAKSRLAEGQHSILRVKPTIEGDIKYLRWNIRPFGYARPIAKRTQVPKRVSDGELRARALATADKILSEQGLGNAWTTASEVSEYVDLVVRPMIENSSKLSLNTKNRYFLSLKHLFGECSDSEHKHVKSLAKMNIRSASRYRVLVDCLQEIARFHGEESARQARTVLSGYVLQQLQHDELLMANPILGTRIDLATGARKREGGKEGGLALSRSDYFRAVDYLLALDPAEGAVAPSRGRWTIEDVIAKRRNSIDLTLLQAATGLRISEARQAWCGLFVDSTEGLFIDVVPEIAKGAISRRAFVLEPRVSARVKELIDSADDPAQLLVSSPFNKTMVWDLRNASKAVSDLYLEMHEKLGISEFKTERSHIWRATLNTLLVDVVPEVMRAAQFGHTSEVNRKSYTDKALSPEMVLASKNALKNK